MPFSTFVFWLRMGLDRVVLVQWLKFRNYSFEKIYFSFERLLCVFVVHKFKNVTELLENRELVTCESKVATELSHAHWTDSERLVVSFIQLAWPVHEALVMFTVPDTQHVRDLMTSRLNSSILYLTSYLWAKMPRVIHLSFRKIRMMSSVRLDANSPRLLCHAENEGPAIFGIKIRVSQN